MNSFKINLFTTVITVAIVALLTYCLYIWTDKEANVALFTTGNALILFATLFGVMGFSLESKRTLIMVRTISAIFFIVMLISCIIFCSVGTGNPPYIIVNGLLLLIYILTIYYAIKADV